MEIELIKSEVAEAAAITKANFAHMSHEIRTPLNGVIGFTDFSEIKYGKHHLEYMSTVNESATILMHIINDILIFLKLKLAS
jgi:signal transduction histidine kinase